MGCLYSVTSPTGKIYIGISIKTAAIRWKKHCEQASSSRRTGALYAAIRKYGVDAFTIKTLLICNDWVYLCDMEKRTIAAYGTLSPSGYNLTTGGEGIVGRFITDEARLNMSLGQKKRFENIEEREKAIENLLRGRANIDWENHTAVMRSPEVREKLSRAATKQFTDPAQREAASEKTKELWRNRPELKGIVSEAASIWRENPENQINHSNATRVGMKNPDVAAKVKTAAQARAADPEWRLKISTAKTGKKLGPCSADRKAKIAEARRQEWRDPIIRERRLKALAIARAARSAKKEEKNS